jgi:hypothetical protein
MRFYAVFLAGLLAVVAMGCEEPITGDDEEPTEAAETPRVTAAEPGVRPLAVNVGDVEAQFEILARLPEGWSHPRVETELFGDRRADVQYLRLRLLPPYPESLPVRFTLSGEEQFADTPVVFRVDIERGDEVISEFNAVMGKDARTAIVEQTVDVMAGWTPPAGDSVLVMARAEALLMPEGTDETTINPGTATTTPARTTEVRSNPVRLQFVEAPAPEAAAPAEPAPGAGETLTETPQLPGDAPPPEADAAEPPPVAPEPGTAAPPPAPEAGESEPEPAG